MTSPAAAAALVSWPKCKRLGSINMLHSYWDLLQQLGLAVRILLLNLKLFTAIIMLRNTRMLAGLIL